MLYILLHVLQQRGQPNFAAWYKEWNYGTFAEGTIYFRLGSHHVGWTSAHIQVNFLSEL